MPFLVFFFLTAVSVQIAMLPQSLILREAKLKNDPPMNSLLRNYRLSNTYWTGDISWLSKVRSLQIHYMHLSVSVIYFIYLFVIYYTMKMYCVGLTPSRTDDLYLVKNTCNWIFLCETILDGRILTSYLC